MQQWLLLHKVQIIRMWYALLIAWLLFFLLTLQVLDTRQWLWWGRQSASISVIVFWLTLMPGILKRFQIGGRLLQLRTLMVLYRRQMGITMYVFAFTHLMWSRFMPILSFGGNIWLFSPFEIMGVAAFLLLTPVFITSNEFSVKTLGRFWRTVHALVYIVIWVVFLHIALQGVGWRAFITLIVAALETFSLIWKKVQDSRTPAANQALRQPQ